MRPGRRAVATLAVMLVVAACSSHRRVLMPARIDLRSFGALGMIEFSSRQPGELDAQATREFLAAVQAAQPGTPVLELGERGRLLSAVGRSGLDSDAIRAIGASKRVDALIVGELDARRIEPGVHVGWGLESLTASAELEGALAVRIYDTKSGATLWTGSVRRREPIAGMTVANGSISGVGATDPSAAEGRLVRGLAQAVTGDFWPYWTNAD